MLDQEDVPYALAVDLGDPAALPDRIEVRDELVDDSCNQRLERFVPSILFGIAETLLIDHPAHISNPMRGRDVGRSLRIAPGKNSLNRPHIVDQLRARRTGKILENRTRLLVG